MEKPLRLRTQKVSKSFSGHKALEEVSLDFRGGEVLVLMGENGAGKSTLMKILAGVWPYGTYEGKVERPTSSGFEELKFQSTREALSSEIAMIYQELSLFPELTVAEHLELENLPHLVNWPSLFSRVQNFLDEVGLDLDAKSTVGSLPIGERQMVEIARALYRKANVLVFDEPTSALTEQETKVLYAIISDLKKKGKSIIYITHRMNEVFELADRIAVLRDGKLAEVIQVREDEHSLYPREELEPRLIASMVGRSIKDIYPPRNQKKGPERLKIEGLKLLSPKNRVIVENISFAVREGEILGLGGLLGSGRSETLESIFGVIHGAGPRGSGYRVEGKILIDGVEISGHRPQGAIKSRVAFVSEDRKKGGLVLHQSIRWNQSLPSLSAYRAGITSEKKRSLGMVSMPNEKKASEHWAAALRIRSVGIDQSVGELSGGNQQKVVISKWLMTEPKILLLDEPTRGVDVGAKVEIYHLIQELASRGMAIVLASSEMPELIGLCDRILVLREGRPSDEFSSQHATQENIMKAAALA